MTLLLASVAALTFNATIAPDRAGVLGRVALRAALFPGLVSSAWEEAGDRLSGRESYKYLAVPQPDFDYAGFHPIRSADGVAETGLVMRGSPSGAERGWRLLGGAMMLDGRVQNAVALLDPGFTIRSVWELNEDGVSLSRDADLARRIVHGLAMLADGSIIVSFDNGSSLQRLDPCGERAWMLEGRYHHAVVHNEESGTLWALRDDIPTPETSGSPTPEIGGAEQLRSGFVEVDADSGTVLREITMRAVIDANPGLGLFELQRLDANLEATNAPFDAGMWYDDPFHFNDVDPLPKKLAAAFPQFTPGDLLISSRSLNAVFVLDPTSLQVKWYRVGATLRQHDPDWTPNGTFIVFDNRMGKGTSRIVEIDPETYNVTTTFDGREDQFYTRIRGRQMLTDNGSMMVTSPQQGRAFEVDGSGQIAMEFFNLGPDGTDLHLALTELLWFPEHALTGKEATCVHQ